MNLNKLKHSEAEPNYEFYCGGLHTCPTDEFDETTEKCKNCLEAYEN